MPRRLRGRTEPALMKSTGRCSRTGTRYPEQGTERRSVQEGEVLGSSTSQVSGPGQPAAIIIMTSCRSAAKLARPTWPAAFAFAPPINLLTRRENVWHGHAEAQKRPLSKREGEGELGREHIARRPVAAWRLCSTRQTAAAKPRRRAQPTPTTTLPDMSASNKSSQSPRRTRLPVRPAGGIPATCWDGDLAGVCSGLCYSGPARLSRPRHRMRTYT